MRRLRRLDGALPVRSWPTEGRGRRPALLGLRILLVEDEPDTLEMFHDALEAAGADVRAADTGPAALDVAESGSPILW